MKRIVCISIALLLAVFAAACTPTKVPAPTQDPAPPIVSEPPTASLEPSIPPDNGGTGTGGNAGGTDTIPNYAQGTTVTEADVPEIVTAFQGKYEGAKITRITHGMQGTQQVYVVEYTAQDGTTTETAYIAPGGTFVSPTADEANSGTVSPAPSPAA